MNKIKLIKFYTNGIQENYDILLKEKMYKKEHNGSKFKYVFELAEKDMFKEENAVILAKNADDKLVGVLIVFFNKEETNKYKNYKYKNIGTIGIFVKEECRHKKIATLLVEQFEKDFYPILKYGTDFIFVNALEKAYIIAKKGLNRIIPCKKQNCSMEMTEIIDQRLLNNKN